MQVYYNASFGYIVCAEAAVRGRPAKAVLAPVTVLRPEATELALGTAVRGCLERSRTVAPVDPAAAERYPFWRVSGIESYERFKRQFIGVNVIVEGTTLLILPLDWEPEDRQAYPERRFYLDLPVDLPAEELGEAVAAVLARQPRPVEEYRPSCAPGWGGQADPWQSSGGPAYRGPELPGRDPKKHLFLKVNLVLTVLAAIPIWWHIYEAWKYMSFAGFGSLLVFFFMTPGFLCLIAEAVLFVQAMRREKRSYVVAAHILQIVCGIPSTYFFCLAPGFFLALSVYTVLMVFGIIGLMRLLFLRRR